MSAMKEYGWVELTISFSQNDLDSLAVSATDGGDLSGIIEHILTLAEEKLALMKGELR